MLKLSLKVNGTIYPITRLELVDCKPFIATILKDGNFERYIHSDNPNPNELNFNTALIIEHPRYDALTHIVEVGIKNVLKDLLRQESRGK